MAVDNSPFIGTLDTNLPLNIDPRAEGGPQIRAVKTALVNSFPNIKGEVNASHEDFNYITDNKFQVGMIIMFTGETAPKNWGLCDGTVQQGVLTPDLRDKFIKGWNPVAGEKPGASGDASTVDLSKYIKVGPFKLEKAHLPKIVSNFWGAFDNGENSGGEAFLTGNDSGGRDGRNYQKTTLDGGGQSHTHPIEFTKIEDLKPSWYALAYIMYLGPQPE